MNDLALSVYLADDFRDIPKVSRCAILLEL